MLVKSSKSPNGAVESPTILLNVIFPVLVVTLSREPVGLVSVSLKVTLPLEVVPSALMLRLTIGDGAEIITGLGKVTLPPFPPLATRLIFVPVRVIFPVPITNDKFPALPLLIAVLLAITLATEILLLPPTVNVMLPAALPAVGEVVLESRFCNEREPLLAVIEIFPPLVSVLDVLILVLVVVLMLPVALVILTFPPAVVILPRLVIP